MGSLNKLELNKLIVSMRHNVKRAKVQTVNKLTRQVKQLKNKKAFDELKKKNEAKAERLVNEVLIIKKIPPDEVSAFTLCNTKKVDDILSDPECSLRLKALAKLSNHNSLTPIVEQFRTRYPSWETEFPKVLIALKKREKLQSVKKERRKENSDNDEELSDADMTELGPENKAVSDQENVLRSPVKRKSNSNLKSHQENILHSPVKRKSNSNLKCNNTLSQECEIVSTRGNRFSVSSDDFEIKNSAETQEYSIKCDKSSSGSDDEKSCKVTKNIKPQLAVKKYENKEEKKKFDNSKFTQFSQTIKKTTDSFFLSTDDKPHKTIDHSANKKNKVYNDDIDGNNNSDFEENSETSKPRQLNSTRSNGFNKNPKGNKTFKPKNNSNIFSKSKGVDFKNRKNETRLKDNVNDSQEKLHPSWAAKKKMVTIANFQGKKVTFD